MAKTIKIARTRNAIGHPSKYKAALLGLGPRCIGYTVERENTPTVRDVVNVASFMVKVEE